MANTESSITSDQRELEQDRLTSAEMSIALRRGAVVHVRYCSGRYVLWISEKDGYEYSTIVTVVDDTERDARNKAALILKMDREESLEQNARILESQCNK